MSVLLASFQPKNSMSSADLPASRAAQVRAAQVREEQVRVGQVRAAQVRFDQARLFQVRVAQVRASQAPVSLVTSDPINLWSRRIRARCECGC